MYFAIFVAEKLTFAYMIGGALAAPVTAGVSTPLIGIGTGMYLGAGLGTPN